MLIALFKKNDRPYNLILPCFPQVLTLKNCLIFILKELLHQGRPQNSIVDATINVGVFLDAGMPVFFLVQETCGSFTVIKPRCYFSSVTCELLIAMIFHKELNISQRKTLCNK